MLDTWVQLAIFATGSDKICEMTNRELFLEIQEHSWDRLLVVALLQMRHMSFERSRKLVRLLIGLLFTEGSEHAEPTRGTAPDSVVDGDRPGPLTS